jgi:hypothetical protein
MTKMDEDQHPEADVYVEDPRSAGMLREVIISRDRDLMARIQIVPYGAASVGRALGIMASENRFPRPTIVFLDGDQEASNGCLLLPGGDAPERVIFDALRVQNWEGVAQRVGRDAADVIDACMGAMAAANHKEWVKTAADRLVLGTDVLWQALCAEWARRCLDGNDAQLIVDSIMVALTPVV